MRRSLFVALMVGMVLGVSGCSVETTSTEYDVNYLIDEDGYGVEGIYYACSSGEEGYTDPEGGYRFEVGNDRCEFALNGLYTNLYIANEEAYINGIPYSCNPSGISGTTGDTLGAGGFDYEVDDHCTLYY